MIYNIAANYRPFIGISMLQTKVTPKKLKSLTAGLKRS